MTDMATIQTEMLTEQIDHLNRTLQEMDKQATLHDRWGDVELAEQIRTAITSLKTMRAKCATRIAELQAPT